MLFITHVISYLIKVTDKLNYKIFDPFFKQIFDLLFNSIACEFHNPNYWYILIEGQVSCLGYEFVVWHEILRANLILYKIFTILFCYHYYADLIESQIYKDLLIKFSE